MQRGELITPCFYVSTNVNMDGVDNIDAFFSKATTAVASIFGKPKTCTYISIKREITFAFLQYVMVVLKGSLDISFGGNKEPAAFAEIVSMGGIDSDVKRNLIATLGTILHNRFSIPTTRFFLKVYDTTMPRKLSKL
ncbi:PREDICTED: macrophage migration inhibitory factor homolog [Nicotiana attenuata]|uniref:macrophage migration inhibitory factor homolog n=1 Tax=Nicotiana attenuata TaxID=49451 RepID=UPI000905484E|nr:PREDICTED: macrophage migration inhibitory factor homolog [Nicotiana attenuata]